MTLSPQAQALVDQGRAAQAAKFRGGEVHGSPAEPPRLGLADLCPGLMVEEARTATGAPLTIDLADPRRGFVVDWHTDPETSETFVTLVKNERPRLNSKGVSQWTLRTWRIELGLLDIDPHHVSVADGYHWEISCMGKALYLAHCLGDTRGEWGARHKDLVRWMLSLVEVDDE